MNKLLFTFLITFVQQTICDNSGYGGYGGYGGGYGGHKDEHLALTVSVQKEDVPLKKERDRLVIKLGGDDHPYGKAKHYGHVAYDHGAYGHGAYGHGAYRHGPYGHRRSGYSPQFRDDRYAFDPGYGNNGNNAYDNSGYDLNYAGDYAHENIYELDKLGINYGGGEFALKTCDHGYKLANNY